MLNNKGKALLENLVSSIIVGILILIFILLTVFVADKVTNYVRVLKYGEAFLQTYTSGDFAKLGRVKNIIDNSYLNEYDEEKLMDSTISGMIEGLDDPYAAYYNESAFESFYTETEGEYYGIGIYVSYDTEKNMPIIITPIIGSPAADVGMLPGDYIVYVDELYSSSATYDELVDAIKGKAGTKVRIGLVRYDKDGSYEEIELEVERKKIDLNPITEEVYEGNIGYIKMTSFDEVSYKEFKEKYEDLIKNKAVKGLVIDLRNNPGGILEICADITDLIVPEGKIVYTVDKAGNEEALYSDKKQIEVPLVVLVNEGSASASEVFTAAVKDYGVGKIIGEKTYGKGVVQTLKSLGDGTYIKLTTSEYFSPKGNKINGLGIEPDINVELPEDVESIYSLKYEEDTQLQRAILEVKNMIK